MENALARVFLARVDEAFLWNGDIVMNIFFFFSYIDCPMKD